MAASGISSVHTFPVLFTTLKQACIILNIMFWMHSIWVLDQNASCCLPLSTQPEFTCWRVWLSRQPRLNPHSAESCLPAVRSLSFPLFPQYYMDKELFLLHRLFYGFFKIIHIKDLKQCLEPEQILSQCFIFFCFYPCSSYIKMSWGWEASYIKFSYQLLVLMYWRNFLNYIWQNTINSCCLW